MCDGGQVQRWPGSGLPARTDTRGRGRPSGRNGCGIVGINPHADCTPCSSVCSGPPSGVGRLRDSAEMMRVDADPRSACMHYDARHVAHFDPDPDPLATSLISVVLIAAFIGDACSSRVSRCASSTACNTRTAASGLESRSWVSSARDSARYWALVAQVLHSMWTRGRHVRGRLSVSPRTARYSCPWTPVGAASTGCALELQAGVGPPWLNSSLAGLRASARTMESDAELSGP